MRFVENGGLLFSDDCNHDVNGLYAKSFEAEMHRAFSGADVLVKIPNGHPVYRAFFKFDGPPQTSHELNGWGDNVVHGYCARSSVEAALACLRQSGLRLRMGLRLEEQTLSHA